MYFFKSFSTKPHKEDKRLLGATSGQVNLSDICIPTNFDFLVFYYILFLFYLALSLI